GTPPHSPFPALPRPPRSAARPPGARVSAHPPARGGRMILPFADPAATQVATSGGKGASPARLSQGGFPVPPGIVVPAGAYVAFVDQEPGLRAASAALPY